MRECSEWRGQVPADDILSNKRSGEVRAAFAVDPLTLADPQAFTKPIPYCGAQLLFEVPDEVLVLGVLDR